MRLPRVHVRLPDDRPAGLRDVHDHLCPGREIVELKSLKLYLWSFRQEGAFHEDVTNRVLDDLVRCLRAAAHGRSRGVNVRGGIETTVRAGYP